MLPARQACRERLLRAALDHVEQPGGPASCPDTCEVDDHRDVLVTAAGVPPDVLVDTDRLHAVEPGGVIDEHPLAFGQDRVVGGVPRHPKPFSDPGDAQVSDDDAFQRPPQTPAGKLRPRLGRLAGVLAPHVPHPLHR